MGSSKRDKSRKQAGTGASKPKRPERTTVRFDLATVFPPDDPVAQFVVSLSANHNDLLVSNKAMFPPSNPKDRRVTAAIRMTALRQALGQIWETFVLVKSAAAIDAVMPS